MCLVELKLLLADSYTLGNYSLLVEIFGHFISGEFSRVSNVLLCLRPIPQSWSSLSSFVRFMLAGSIESEAFVGLCSILDKALVQASVFECSLVSGTYHLAGSVWYRKTKPSHSSRCLSFYFPSSHFTI